MTKIIPIRDLKDTSKISEMCHSAKSPVFITKNGYEDMVIMSVDTYDQINKAAFTHSYSIPAQKSSMVADTAQMTYNAGVYSLGEIQRTLDPIFKKFKVKTAVLFGSYAKGQANSQSDIDILVDSGLHGLKFFGLLDAVSEAFNCSVDLIDLLDLKSGSKLDKEIKKHGIRIYG